MEAINYSTAKRNLAKVMDKVTETKTSLMITRKNGEAVVLMSFAEFSALDETAHRLSSPENTLRLSHSIKSAQSRKKYDLGNLLTQIDEKNLDSEVDIGESVGNEKW